MTVTPTCTECNAPIRGSAVLGLCSLCALRAALEAGSTPPDFGFAGEPDVEIHGDYELLEEIGRGGMGVVFRARQRSLNRFVALKVLYGGAFASAAARKHLLSEAAAAARLRHPNIVAVHQTGEWDGQPFYSMDFIAGRTLAEVVHSGPIAPRRAAEWLRKLAAAVHHAHSQNVLHRDLKPSNVLLDDADEPRITDFGLAKLLDSTEAATLTGSIFGSPAYMPPEQATGRISEIGPASDVYSLGAMLYELLAGRPPFQGASPQAVLEQVRTIEPVSLRRLNSDLPADLETITLKCLEKNPAQRYQTAQALADELARYSDGRPIQARPAGAGEKIWRWSRRHPLVSSLVCLSLALLLAIITVVAVSAENIRTSRDQARVRLAESLLSEAHALRLAAEPGWREKSLRNLAEARRLDQNGRLTFQLRGEAIAALARPDLARQMATNFPPVNNVMNLCLDPAFKRAASWNPQTSAVEIRSVTNAKILAICQTTEPDEVHAFSPDGKFLLLRHGGKISVWDTANGAEVITGQDSESHRKYNGGEFSPDGKRFGRGEINGNFCIYDLTATPPRRIIQWPLPDGLVCATVAWSADGTSVALVLGDKTLVVCDANSGQVRWRRNYAEMVWNITWDNARDWLVLQSGDDRVLLLRPEDGSEIDHLNLPQNGTPIARLSPDGNFLAVSGERFGTQIFDAVNRRRLAADPAPAWHLQFDAAGSRLGSQIDHGSPLWLERLPPLVQTTWHSPGQLNENESLAFGGDGRWMVSLTGDGPVVWDFPAGKIMARLKLPGVRAVKVDPESRRLFCLTDDSLFTVWLPEKLDGITPHPERILHGQNLKSFAMAGDGSIAAADFGASSVLLIAGTNRAEIHWPRQPLDVALSPDGRWLACGSYLENDIYVCDLKHPDGPLIRLAGAGGNPIFSADGKELFTFGQEARVWRVTDWQPGPTLPFTANNAEQFIGAASADGRWLAATQRDHEVHLVELATGKVMADLDGPGESGILAMAFSPDGNTLVIGRDRGDLQLWPLPVLKAELDKLGLAW